MGRQNAATAGKNHLARRVGENGEFGFFVSNIERKERVNLIVCLFTPQPGVGP